jgi:hypothetical protein
MQSPDGRRTVRVFFNDAGAAHSGNHWTWVIEDSWVLGRRVVAQGYLGPEFRMGEQPMPLDWRVGDEVHVKFANGRYAR